MEDKFTIGVLCDVEKPISTKNTAGYARNLRNRPVRPRN